MCVYYFSYAPAMSLCESRGAILSWSVLNTKMERAAEASAARSTKPSPFMPRRVSIVVVLFAVCVCMCVYVCDDEGW